MAPIRYISLAVWRRQLSAGLGLAGPGMRGASSPTARIAAGGRQRTRVPPVSSTRCRRTPTPSFGGEVPLDVARQAIARDWHAAYQRVSGRPPSDRVPLPDDRAAREQARPESTLVCRSMAVCRSMDVCRPVNYSPSSATRGTGQPRQGVSHISRVESGRAPAVESGRANRDYPVESGRANK